MGKAQNLDDFKLVSHIPAS